MVDMVMMTKPDLSKREMGDFRAFHVRQTLSDRLEFFDREPDHPGIAGLLFRIPGITRLHVLSYEVVVFKGKAFTWEEIEPLVMEVLAPFTA